MINNNNSEGGNFVMVLCGNKCDVDPALRKVQVQASKELGKKHNMIVAEISAKTGEGVQ